MLDILVVDLLNAYYMPAFYDVENDYIEDDNPCLQLFGLSVDEFSQLYKDTTAELMENAEKTKPEAEAVPEEEDYAEAQ
jgi:hypothetical protein